MLVKQGFRTLFISGCPVARCLQAKIIAHPDFRTAGFCLHWTTTNICCHHHFLHHDFDDDHWDGIFAVYSASCLWREHPLHISTTDKYKYKYRPKYKYKYRHKYLVYLVHSLHSKRILPLSSNNGKDSGNWTASRLWQVTNCYPTQPTLPNPTLTYPTLLFINFSLFW